MKRKNKIKIAKGVLISLGVVFIVNGLWITGSKLYQYLFVNPDMAVAQVNVPNTVDLRQELSCLNNTPMAPAIPIIVAASQHYDLPIGLYLGVANAESSFKNFKGFNPWGIMVNGSVRQYDSWEQSVNGFSQLIKYYYLEQGMVTAEQIMPTYVGYRSDAWLANVKKYYK